MGIFQKKYATPKWQKKKEPKKWWEMKEPEKGVHRDNPYQSDLETRNTVVGFLMLAGFMGGIIFLLHLIGVYY